MLRLIDCETGAMQSSATTSTSARDQLGASDGLLMDATSRLYISALEMTVRGRDKYGQVTTLITDKRLRWPETSAEGTIYVTTSRIQDIAFVQPEPGPRLETALRTFTPSRLHCPDISLHKTGPYDR